MGGTTRVRGSWMSMACIGCGLGLATVLAFAQRPGGLALSDRAVAVAQGGGSVDGGQPPVLFLNLPNVFVPAKAKLASGGTVSVLVIGDSLSFKTGAWPPPFRNFMQNKYGDAGKGYQGFSLVTGGAFNSGWTDGRVNHDDWPHHALDGLWGKADGQGAEADTADFTAWGDQISLHYVAGPGGRVIQVEHPFGVPVALLNCNAAVDELRTFSWSFADPDFRQLWFRPVSSGTGLILGQVNETKQPGVIVHRAANGGWGVDEFLQRDWTFDAQVRELAPDLVFIWLGQNDQGYSYDEYRVEMGLVVDRMQAAAPGAEVVLIGTYDSGSANVVPLVQAMGSLAEARGLGFIDLYSAAGTYQFFRERGYLSDGLHFSISGGQYIAKILFDAFETDGWSLYVACDGDADGDGERGLTDLAAVLQQFGTATFYSAVDMDHDGDVDLWDLAGFLQVFGTPCIPPPIVPPDGGEGTGTTAEDVTYDSWDPAHATQE